jgi:hypothetical protein
MSAQEKVVVLDSVQAKIIALQLIERDFLVNEVFVLKKMDSISSKRIANLELSNKELMGAYVSKEIQLKLIEAASKNKDVIIKKTQSKNKFYKFVSLLSVTVTGILLITR